MDLFKAIFDDSSADESEASEGEENVETEVFIDSVFGEQDS